MKPELFEVPTLGQSEKSLRQIVEECQWSCLTGDGERLTDERAGVMVDLFTASAVLQVLDGLCEKNKAKFLEMNLMRASEVAFAVIEKARKRQEV